MDASNSRLEEVSSILPTSFHVQKEEPRATLLSLSNEGQEMRKAKKFPRLETRVYVTTKPPTNPSLTSGCLSGGKSKENREGKQTIMDCSLGFNARKKLKETLPSKLTLKEIKNIYLRYTPDLGRNFKLTNRATEQYVLKMGNSTNQSTDDHSQPIDDPSQPTDTRITLKQKKALKEEKQSDPTLLTVNNADFGLFNQHKNGQMYLKCLQMAIMKEIPLGIIGDDSLKLIQRILRVQNRRSLKLC